MRARGLHGGAAVWAEGEFCYDLCAAVGAGRRQLIAQNEIKNDANGVGKKDGQQRPHHVAHAALLRVAVDEADEHHVNKREGAAEYRQDDFRRHWQSSFGGLRRKMCKVHG